MFRSSQVRRSSVVLGVVCSAAFILFTAPCLAGVAAREISSPVLAPVGFDPSGTSGDEISAFALLAGSGDVDSSTSPSGGDTSVPPEHYSYRCRVIDDDTGLPVPGAKVRATEKVLLTRCWRINQYGQCYDCAQEDMFVSRTGTTGAGGTTTITFDLYHCQVVSADPPEWDTTTHLGWQPAQIVEVITATGSSEWIYARAEDGPDPYDETIFVTHESRLADRFSPIIHRHPAFELQDDLADFEQTLAEDATLSGYDVLGSRLYGPAPMPPAHVWDAWHWDTYGSGQTVAYWMVDIDDGARHEGAPAGERSLYTHVFPWGGGAVIQYWLWMNANDLSQQWGFGWHEGDWEYASVYVRYEAGAWKPQGVNLSQHVGGESLFPEDCWWSPSNDLSYANLQQGSTGDATHLHVWAASNSHALYSRYSSQYTIEVDAEYCPGQWHDQVDYGWGLPVPQTQVYFPYDRLVPMGEFVWGSQAHGYTWFSHCDGGALDALCLQAVFGEGECVEPNECAFFPCELIEFFDVGDWFEGTTVGPRSPLVPQEPHKWRDFVSTPGLWGNDHQMVRYESHPPQQCLVGVYGICSAQDQIVFEAIPRTPTEPGDARFRVVSGDVEVFGETSGETSCTLINGRYRVTTMGITGTGELEFSVYPEQDYGDPVAISMRARVVTCGDGGVSDVAEDGGPGDPAGGDLPATPTDGDPRTVAPATLSPSPAHGPVSVRFGEPLGRATVVEIHDVGGALVRRLAAQTGQSELAWDGRGDDGRALPGGLYLVSIPEGGGRRSLGKVTLLRD